MFHYPFSNSKLVAFLKLAAICATTAIVCLCLSTSMAQADSYGSFDETGQYNYHNSGSSLRPSIGQPGYEENRRASELQASEAERWRQEALRQERERNTPPARPPAYEESYWVQKDGKSTLCVPQYNKAIVSCY